MELKYGKCRHVSSDQFNQIVGKKFRLSKYKVKDIIEYIFNEIAEKTLEGTDIRINNFGVFKRYLTSARMSYSMFRKDAKVTSDGLSVLEPYYTIKFVKSKHLKNKFRAKKVEE